MATFDFQGKSVYFETHGEGRPLVVLNGIMMSAASWSEFVEPFSANNQLILLDLLDQGRSDKMVGEVYTQEIQVEVVAALVAELGLEKVSVLGISYGGEVALQLVLKYPELIDRLMLFNTTAATGPWLGDIGDGWNKALDDAEAYYYTTIPIIYSPAFYKGNREWMENRKELLCSTVFNNPDFMGSMERLTNSAAGYDVSNRLSEISAPTLVVSAQQDYLTPIEEQQKIVAGIPSSHYAIIPGSGHASMYEQPVLFCALALGFLNNTKTEFHIV
ncbi:MAG: alpha/beta hydrolase [Atopobiaceae bacterium]|nr:alpha/beta hydrolase [Atopobiaceae bacterium]